MEEEKEAWVYFVEILINQGRYDEADNACDAPSAAASVRLFKSLKNMPLACFLII
ncbi:unnamed protein product [marine sediment metagenome]|uniref:Uncharacterized protein n=1 Tax=marine sediment metagenome TaxID=412755 RepID=X1JUZ2_9ZZZZ